MVVAISFSPPIISLRGGFVYFPNSTEATRVEPRRKGAAGPTGRGNRHPVSHRLGFHSGNVAERQSAETYDKSFLELFEAVFWYSATASVRDHC